MEISPRDAVPYLDRIPWGVIDLLQSLGVKVVSSAGLVTRFAATWTAAETAEHVQAAELLRDDCARCAGQGGPPGRHRVHRIGDAGRGGGGDRGGGDVPRPRADRRVRPERRDARTTSRIPGPIARWGATRWCCSTSLPGCAPGRSSPTRPGWDSPEVQFRQRVADGLDAWCATPATRPSPHCGPGSEPASRCWGIWATRRRAAVIEKAGFGEFFVHRTGHSIDRDLHGSGPHLDDYETHDDRALQPGTGCSVEPGIYLPGDFGVRSEVNLYWGDAKASMVTPREPQTALVTVT